MCIFLALHVAPALVRLLQPATDYHAKEYLRCVCLVAKAVVRVLVACARVMVVPHGSDVR